MNKHEVRERSNQVRAQAKNAGSVRLEGMIQGTGDTSWFEH